MTPAEAEKQAAELAVDCVLERSANAGVKRIAEALLAAYATGRDDAAAECDTLASNLHEPGKTAAESCARLIRTLGVTRVPLATARPK